MIGRVHARDRSTGASDQPGYDPLGRYGAGVLYAAGVKLKHLQAPQNLTASPRPSETNIGNMPVRIVVAQLAPQTQSRLFQKMLSRPVVLRPGNQSLGGT